MSNNNNYSNQQISKPVYNIKWQNDIKSYINTFNSFILEGNINDFQPIEIANNYSYLQLQKTIAEMFKDKYFVVFFDHLRESKPSETCCENADEKDKKIKAEDFGSFEVYKGTTKENIEFFKYYFSKEYEEKTSSSVRGLMADFNGIASKLRNDLRKIYDIMSEYNSKKKDGMKPFLFVLPYVSRYMTHPGNPSENENAFLQCLFNATQISDTECKLFLCVDKMNDLPTWFESENTNTGIKKVFIPLPDSKFRETYYSLEMKKIIENESDKSIQKYVAYTDKYSVRRLQQLKSYIINSESGDVKNLNNIDKTIFMFESGQSTNPWKDPNLKKAIKELPSDLKKIVVGQDKAIDKITNVLKTAVTGVSTSKRNDRRPRAVFFFAGPTGVGKTEVAKQLSEVIFKRQDSIIRFDMSEFREEHTDARLFGAPPGYVGYEAGGELTKSIKQNPFSIVLFDEIEKANPKIWDKFLQILGDGRLTDGKGETVDFSQSIIIFTSNLGIAADAVNDPISKAQKAQTVSEINSKIRNEYGQLESSNNNKEEIELHAKELFNLYLEKTPLVGMSAELRKEKLFTEYYRYLNEYSSYNAFATFVSESVQSRVKKYFDDIERREVFGRIGSDNLLVFNFILPAENKSINNGDAEEIAIKTINNYISYLKNDYDYHIVLEVTDSAKKYIIDKICEPQVLNYGGRGIYTSVEKYLSEAVAEYCFENDNIENSKVKLDFDIDINKLLCFKG